MNVSQWARLKEYFGDAIEAPPDELGRIIAAAEAESPDLAHELRSLLCEHASNILNTAAVRQPPAPPVENVSRERVSNYRLLRELGRGGAGIVFLAEREDDEFHRPVALKLLRYAAWDKQSERLLTHERQALSQLRHPNIAALVDWGITPDEVPWLAVEYVEGESIDQHCRTRSLDTPAILQLFGQVCEAVQYAHRHLIVHRDLKPANVLVTPEGVVKLLDFGISKLMEQQGATATMERRFTPAYASPEQIEGGAITGATDVYSLGLLLYELLTGRLPHTGDTLSEVMKKVLEDRPAAASATPGLSRERRAALTGDLDRIVLHMLEKSPERRYPSVEQLLADLERLRSGFPISVRAPGTAYRVSKFVRRNLVVVTAGVLAAAALLAGASVAVWQACEARREQQAAEHRFKDLRTLAHSVIFDLHDAINRVPGSVEARRTLIKTALKYLDGLKAERGNDDSIQMELAGAYYRMAYAQGGIVGMNLGDAVGGRKSYRTALEILNEQWRRHPDDDDIGSLRFAVAFNTALSRNNPADGAVIAAKYSAEADGWAVRQKTTATLHSAGLLHQTVGRISRSAGQLEEALRHLDIAMQQFGKLNQIASEKPIYGMGGAAVSVDEGFHMMGLTETMRGQTFIDRGEFSKAIDALHASQKHEAGVLAMDNDSPAARRAMAVSHGHLSVALLGLKRDAAALQEAREELALTQALVTRDANNVTFRRDQTQAWRHMGTALCATGSCAEAVKLLEQTAAEMAKIGDADPAFLFNRLFEAGGLNDLGEAQLSAGQMTAAREAFGKARDWCDKALAEAPGWLEFLRERARAYHGLANSGATAKQKEFAGLATADWERLWRESPLHRRDRVIR